MTQATGSTTFNQGRCSNDPALCSLAREQVLVPWAGLGSICPECGSPVARVANAAIAGDIHGSPLESSGTVAAGLPQSRPSDQWQALPEGTGLEGLDDARAAARRQEQPEPERANGSGFLLTSVLVLLALIGGFAVFRFLDSRNTIEFQSGVLPPVEDPAALPGFVPLSPPDMLEVTLGLTAYERPDATSAVLGQIGAGTLIDVTGTIGSETGGWAQIIMPGRQTVRGWVQRGGLSRLRGMPELADTDALLPDASTAGVGLASAIQELQRFIAYVTPAQVTVHAEAGNGSLILGQLPQGAALIVNAARAMPDGPWYRIDLDAGGTGWIKADLLGRDRPQTVPSAGAETGAEDSQQPSQAPAIPPRDQSADQAANLAKPPANNGGTQETLAQTVPPPSPGTGDSRPQRVIVIAAEANLRNAPRLRDDTIVAALPNGARLEVVDQRTFAGRLWYSVRTGDGATGWVSASTVKPD